MVKNQEIQVRTPPNFFSDSESYDIQLTYIRVRKKSVENFQLGQTSLRDIIDYSRMLCYCLTPQVYNIYFDPSVISSAIAAQYHGG